MSKATFLSIVSCLLLVGLNWGLGFRVEGYQPTRFISELGAIGMPGRSLANGAFFLIGAFWMGTVEAVRKSLEPARLDPWVRFGVIAFAASYIASVVFPCDLNCPIGGSINQVAHNTLVWVLYAGAAVAGVRLPVAGRQALVLALKTGLILFFLAMQAAAWERDWWPGLWQRGYELCFVALWLLWLNALSHRHHTPPDRRTETP